jgi:hypothetical protein
VPILRWFLGVPLSVVIVLLHLDVIGTDVQSDGCKRGNWDGRSGFRRRLAAASAVTGKVVCCLVAGVAAAWFQKSRPIPLPPGPT